MRKLNNVDDKELLRNQHEYTKATINSTFYTPIFLSFVLFLLSKDSSMNINKIVLNLLVILFIYILVYYKFKQDYYEELYYSHIVDLNNRYYKTYKSLKTERRFLKRVYLSLFGFGCRYSIENAIILIFSILISVKLILLLF